MITDFRALCAEAVSRWDNANGDHDFCGLADIMDRARSALAKPEAELPPRPPLHPAVDRPDLVRYGASWEFSTDRPLLAPMPDGYWTPWHVAARLPQPIPVFERLPGEGDCDAEGRCWWFVPPACRPHKIRPCWTFDSLPLPEDTHWLPWWAVPIPQEAQSNG
jgi:hypothetical protein